MNDNSKKLLCKLCKKKTIVNGFLIKCTNIKCNVQYWSESFWKKYKEEKLFYEIVKNKKKLTKHFYDVIQEAKIKKPNPGESFVYLIKLKKKEQLVNLKDIILRDKRNINKKEYNYYVGKTNKHPLERYLRHKIGYQAGKKIVQHYGIAMIKYEGPMTGKASEKREVDLAEELRLKGFNVYQK